MAEDKRNNICYAMFSNDAISIHNRLKKNYSRKTV